MGEIYVRGMNVMLGYYKNQEATQEVMLPDGWMRTGDLGSIDRDGFLFIRGRCKTMILGPNGQNIYPEEIESILNTLPYVVESLIISYKETSSAKETIKALISPDWDGAKKASLSTEMLHQQMSDNIDTLHKRIHYYRKCT